MLPSVHKNSEREWNPVPLPLYSYLSRSALLVSFTASNNPDKQLAIVNFEHGSNSYDI